MKRTILTLAALAISAVGLSACVTYPAGPRERVVVYEHGVWAAGHYDRFGVWVPGLGAEVLSASTSHA